MSQLSGDVLICPNCRARVFGSWQVCKFCGEALRVALIDAAVDPDRLVEPGHVGGDAPGGGPDAPPAEPLGGGSGPRSPWGNAWSAWAGSEEATGSDSTGSASGAGSGGSGHGGAPGGYSGEGTGPGGATGWDAPDSGPASAMGSTGWADRGSPGASGSVSEPGSTAWDTPGTDPRGADGGWGAVGTGDVGNQGPLEEPGDSESLVPLDEPDPTWLPGPAPAVPGDTDPSVGAAEGAAQAAAWVTDEGPSGLDPVSWYPEPGSTPSFGSSDTGPPPAGSASAATGWDLPAAGFAPPEEPSATGTNAPADTGPSVAGPDMDADTERFDHEAIFRGPEPGSEPEPTPQDEGSLGSDLEPVAPGGEVAVNWQPAAADAWATPIEPEGKPKRQAVLSRESRLLLAGIVFVLIVLAAALGLQEREADNHPSAWSANVQEIADWVSKTRKLPFEHPVAVVTMNSGDYDAAVRNAGVPSDSGTRENLADQVAMWRALGGVQGDPSARLNAAAAQRPDLGAFYDLDEKRLVLRDGPDVASLREGAAGALSVALDDQHADLSSLQSSGIGENPRFDVVLGTAELIRSDYLRQSSGGGVPKQPESAEIDASMGLIAARPLLQTRLGGPFVQMVRDIQDLEAANGLAGSPPVSSQQVMLPMAYFDGRGPLSVPQPEAPEGTEKLDTGSLGAQTWYLLIAAHLKDPAKLNGALAFADRWAGDSYVSYRKPNGQVCVSDVMRGSDESQTALLAVTLNGWRDSLPKDRIEVKMEGSIITIVGCDPGASANQGIQEMLGAATSAAVTRSELAAEYYLAGTKIPNGVNGPVFTPEVAWCMGNEAVLLARPGQITSLASRKGPVYRSLTLQAGKKCNSNMADQLFTGPSD